MTREMGLQIITFRARERFVPEAWVLFAGGAGEASEIPGESR